MTAAETTLLRASAASSSSQRSATGPQRITEPLPAALRPESSQTLRDGSNASPPFPPTGSRGGSPDGSSP